MNPSSHPNERLTHSRMYTRRVTTMEAITVKMRATTMKAVPLFCLPPGGSCNAALMIGAQLFPVWANGREIVRRMGKRDLDKKEYADHSRDRPQVDDEDDASYEKICCISL